MTPDLPTHAPVAADPRRARFAEAERRVAQHQAGLRKELRLTDLVFSQIAYIVGLTWLGTAAKLGGSQVVFWIPAVLLFYIPSGVVVVHLNREMPLEGGMYQWAKLRFGELWGFLVALNLFASVVLGFGTVASLTAVSLSYLDGPRTAWIAEDKRLTLALGIGLIWLLTWAAVRGLSLAKWIHNAASVGLLSLFVGIVAFAAPRWLSGNVAAPPAALAAPALTLLNLNLLAKMGFGAFSGFDAMAVFAGEMRSDDAARLMRRSVLIAGPIIAVIYVLGTACALTFTAPAELDLVSPALQAFTRGTQSMGTGVAAVLIPVGVLCAILQGVGYTSIGVNPVVRLPMVAGWDELLPGWLSRLHPRYKTPVGSALLIGGAATVLTGIVSVSAGAQEAYQLLLSANLVAWALTYLVMFAIPLVAPAEKPPLGVRAAATCGFAMTLLFAALSIFPVVDVPRPAVFALEIGAVIVAINVGGALLFLRASRARANS